MLMWLNVSTVILNATLQLLVIYRLDEKMCLYLIREPNVLSSFISDNIPLKWEGYCLHAFPAVSEPQQGLNLFERKTKQSCQSYLEFPSSVYHLRPCLLRLGDQQQPQGDWHSSFHQELQSFHNDT